MVRVLLAVHGEGNGHMTRCKAILNHLAQEHEVVVVADGRSSSYLAPYAQHVVGVASPHLSYRNNKISPLRTLGINLLRLPDFIASAKRLNGVIKRFKPQVIVNDFNALASYLGAWYGVPSVTVDNNQLVLVSKMRLPLKWSWARFKAAVAIRLMVPFADLRLIPSFVFPELTRKDVQLVPPILREEIRSLKPTNGDHVLVYQTSASNKGLLDVLRGIDQRFVVYGFEKDCQMDNVMLKRFSDRGFLRDLRSAKAVIMNGGFSLMTECIYLKKPILSIPVKGQIEQMINARELERQGLGMSSDDNDPRKIRDFLASLKTPKKTPGFDYDLPLRRIDQIIKRLVS